MRKLWSLFISIMPFFLFLGACKSVNDEIPVTSSTKLEGGQVRGADIDLFNVMLVNKDTDGNCFFTYEIRGCISFGLSARELHHLQIIQSVVQDSIDADNHELLVDIVPVQSGALGKASSGITESCFHFTKEYFISQKDLNGINRVRFVCGGEEQIIDFN